MSDPAVSELGGRAARGALSTGTGLLVRMSLQMGSVIVLSRLLSPREYGLIAMVLAVIGIGETLRDSGLSSAAIQSKDLSRSQRSNLFWTNTAIGTALAVVGFALSGVIAAFYDEPELVRITQLLSLTFVLNGMMTQFRADLIRSMRFRVVARIDVLATAFALATAVVLASLGAGYWALVTQQLVQAACALVAVVIAGRWMPLRYARDVPMRHLYTFGGNLLGSQLVGYVANNVDALVIGSRFGAAPLGLYNRAFQLLMNPLNQVRAPSTTVALPVLSRAGETPSFNGIVRTGQLVLAYPVTVGLAIVIGVSYPLVDVLLGREWSAVAPILRFLALAGIFQTLAYVGYWVYLSRGLTRPLLHYSFLSAAIRITCVLIGSNWGVLGVAAGYALAPMLAWPLSLWWLGRVTTLPIADLYRGAGRCLAVGAVTGATTAAATYALADHGSWLQLAVGVCAGMAATSLLLLLPPVRRDLGTLLHAGRAALRRPRRA
ncbi:lipopolysaccharide biosynthesis protein [Cellulomonas sp. ATA003]|uniref:lipopolysaccharide biosynthesis protein n=1 Tax=Cellulomonas sp. ATA003 TaxID=3073064 RepID=UPI002873030E|nr:lipopolysaccharide biosynthesis protein [Cellulomonas sp. ATA003]WNB85083.1 lipopolysaccharide biosynthesis protein [Cellulomonas sp. ATA003]